MGKRAGMSENEHSSIFANCNFDTVHKYPFRGHTRVILCNHFHIQTCSLIMYYITNFNKYVKKKKKVCQ